MGEPLPANFPTVPADLQTGHNEISHRDGGTPDLTWINALTNVMCQSSCSVSAGPCQLPFAVSGLLLEYTWSNGMGPKVALPERSTKVREFVYLRHIAGLGRTVAGLLVFAILVAVSGASAASSSRQGPLQGRAFRIHEATTVVCSASVPAGHDNCDDDLLCRASGQCSTHISWLPVPEQSFPALHRIAVGTLHGRASLLVGISTSPISPPPRLSA